MQDGVERTAGALTKDSPHCFYFNGKDTISLAMSNIFRRKQMLLLCPQTNPADAVNANELSTDIVFADSSN